MCTLTYLLNENGYEIFFNRDEQRSRSIAIPPVFYSSLNAIYPIDPLGKGTWIAVNQHGLTLALLNNYQAPFNSNPDIVSRGQLILSLLQLKGNLIKRLKTMNLEIYQPFQLCIFPESLSIHNAQIHYIKWTGNEIIIDEMSLPITSSRVDFEQVKQQRVQRFTSLVDAIKPSSEQLKNYHFSTETIGKYSVNMQRKDAQTVSISHISVCNTINFTYFDNVLKKEYSIELEKVILPEFVS